MKTESSTTFEYAANSVNDFAGKLSRDLGTEDSIRVMWLSATLFFIVGGYWLLRSIKDPIIGIIDGV